MARARAVKPDFERDEAVAEICRRLDDLPLALELAAARVKALSPTQILERLEQRLPLLTGGARDATRAAADAAGDDRVVVRPARRRGEVALRPARGLPRRLHPRGGRGGRRRDLDILQSLVDKSLLRHAEERFWMLETIREYARERLAGTDEEADLRRRHAVSALDFVETIRRDMEEGGDQMVGLAQIDVEHDNLRAALEWARDSRAGRGFAASCRRARVLLASARLLRRGRFVVPLALERGSSPATARMWVLLGASMRAAATRDYDRSDAYVAEWRSLAELTGDEGQLLRAMNSAALNASEQGDLDRARAEFVAIGERAREIGDRMMVAFATINLGMVAWEGRDFQAALEYSERASRALPRAGRSWWCGLSPRNLRLEQPRALGSEHAEASFREALALACGLAWKRGVAVYAAGLATTLVAGGKAEQAAQLYGAVASIHEELGILFDDAFQEQVH